MRKFYMAVLVAGGFFLALPLAAQEAPGTPPPQAGPGMTPSMRASPPLQSQTAPSQTTNADEARRAFEQAARANAQNNRFPRGAPVPGNTTPPPATQTWAQKLPQGGTTTIVQILLSMIGGAFALERLFGLRRKAIAPAGLAQQANELWQAGKLDEIEKLCNENPSTLASIISFTVRHRTSSLADVSLIAGDIASRDIGAHLQRAYPLAVVATLEPLLGLLGTVLGMIESFDAIVRTGTLADPILLADGISKALITTAVGLIIAIPFLGFYHYFRSRTNAYATILEAEATELISEWLLAKPGGDNARPEA